MTITMAIFFNIVLGFFINRTWNYFKVSKRKNEIKQYPVWAKSTIIFVILLCLISIVMQIILFISGEQKMAMSMLLLACVLQFASGNMLKPREENE